METENKDWKPEVGKHVWVVENYAILQKKVLRVDPSLCCLLRGRRGDDFCEGFKCHPTPEAALASIKIYDLEGKEVVIPRAEPDFLLQELESSGRILSLLEKEFFEFCKQDPENVAKFGLALMGGGAAIGGKSDQREGGC